MFVNTILTEYWEQNRQKCILSLPLRLCLQSLFPVKSRLPPHSLAVGRWQTCVGLHTAGAAHRPHCASDRSERLSQRRGWLYLGCCEHFIYIHKTQTLVLRDIGLESVNVHWRLLPNSIRKRTGGWNAGVWQYSVWMYNVGKYKL